MLHATNSHLNLGWTRGVVSFQNPIVLSYGNTSGDAAGWKSRLSKEFGGKVGAALTAKLRSLGYDGIVTGGRHGTDEIVDLNPVRNPKKRMGKILKFPKRNITSAAKKRVGAPSSPPTPRRNPGKAITLTGPQIREFLRFQGGHGEILDKRIGRSLRDKGLVQGRESSTWVGKGFYKHGVAWDTTDLGGRVSKAIWAKSRDLPSYYDDIDWSKISITISEK